MGRDAEFGTLLMFLGSLTTPTPISPLCSRDILGTLVAGIYPLNSVARWSHVALAQ